MPEGQTDIGRNLILADLALYSRMRTGLWDLLFAGWLT